MKTRLGFVSNSSSASFVIDRNQLTSGHDTKLAYHVSYASKQGWNDLGIYWSHGILTDWWDIESTEDGHAYYASTTMTNFDLREFCRRIGIPDAAISQEEDNG